MTTRDQIIDDMKRATTATEITMLGQELDRDSILRHLAGAPRLTPEDVALLRRPFHANAVKWLPIGKLVRKGAAVQMLPHIDASLVIERLAEVDPSFTKRATPMLQGANPADPFGVQHGTPFECVLTVKGVTRSDYGGRAPGAKLDDKYLKEAASDSLKRAALMFGVGAYLRAMPQIYLPQMADGKETFWTRPDPKADSGKKFGGLQPAGKKVLRAEYVKVVTHEAFVDHYGPVVDYGDLADDDVTDESVDVDTTPTAVMNTVEVEVLVLLGGYIGRKTTAEHRRAALEASEKPFAKELAPVLNGVKAALKVSGEDLERLRGLAIGAASGDEAALAQLTEGLETLKDLATQAGDA